jgi:hypothetical protein
LIEACLRTLMTIEDEAKQIRRRIPRMTPGQKRRFEPKLRERILEWVGRAHAEGLRDADCSRLLGISAPQFNAWRQMSVPIEIPMELTVPPVSNDLVPIIIPEGIELMGGVVFVTPNGCRVEGLNLEQAYALLREFV